jgi:glycosyltransferase involved in cell wall biosynthesis
MRDTLFLDICCPKPYTKETLQNEPLGGTEATVIRVAESLDAFVWQHNRLKTEGRYLASHARPSGIKRVVVLRLTAGLQLAKAMFPKAKISFWMHDVAGNDLFQNAHLLAAWGIDIVGVSAWHREQIRDRLLQTRVEGKVPVSFIYNPVDEALQPGSETRPEKLVFFSSPHKGLDQTLEFFTYVRRALPDSLLYLFNPGYQTKDLVSLPGVVNRGPKPHPEVVEEVKDSLCTFYINRVVPETFGLVYAESNAVGVPVLAHSIGAAPEVLSPAAPQLVDTASPKAVVETIKLWREKGRPKVECKPEFRLKTVVDQWRFFLS